MIFAILLCAKFAKRQTLLLWREVFEIVQKRWRRVRKETDGGAGGKVRPAVL